MKVIIALLLIVGVANACTYAGYSYDCGAKNAQGQYCNWMIVGNNCGSGGAGKCCGWVWCAKIADCTCGVWSTSCPTTAFNETYN